VVILTKKLKFGNRLHVYPGIQGTIGNASFNTVEIVIFLFLSYMAVLVICLIKIVRKFEEDQFI
jgi:hypothetical protein